MTTTMTRTEARPSTTHLEVTHHFDAAHRLAHLPGKCQSWHGHTWQVALQLTGDVTDSGMVIDFSDVKSQLREWIDLTLDHGTLIGVEDRLLPHLIDDTNTKLFVFDGVRTEDRWPTVEAVAAAIGRHMCAVADPSVRITEVRVQETVSNVAIWRPAE